MARLRHIALAVEDPEKAAEFYIKAFGMSRVGETDWINAKGVYLSDGVINLALLKYKTEEAAGARGTGFSGSMTCRKPKRPSRTPAAPTGWEKCPKPAAFTK